MQNKDYYTAAIFQKGTMIVFVFFNFSHDIRVSLFSANRIGETLS